MPKNKAKVRAKGGPKKPPGFKFLNNRGPITAITFNENEAGNQCLTIYKWFRLHDSVPIVTVLYGGTEIQFTSPGHELCHDETSSITLSHFHVSYTPPIRADIQMVVATLESYKVLNQDNSTEQLLEPQEISAISKSFGIYSILKTANKLNEMYEASNVAWYRAGNYPTLLQHSKCLDTSSKPCFLPSTNRDAVKSNPWLVGAAVLVTAFGGFFCCRRKKPPQVVKGVQPHLKIAKSFI